LSITSSLRLWSSRTRVYCLNKHLFKIIYIKYLLHWRKENYFLFSLFSLKKSQPFVRWILQTRCRIHTLSFLKLFLYFSLVSDFNSTVYVRHPWNSINWTEIRIIYTLSFLKLFLYFTLVSDFNSTVYGSHPWNSISWTEIRIIYTLSFLKLFLYFALVSDFNSTVYVSHPWNSQLDRN